MQMKHLIVLSVKELKQTCTDSLLVELRYPIVLLIRSTVHEKTLEQLEMFFPRMYGKKRITYISMLVRNASKSIGRRSRLVFLEEIIKRLQALNGLMESSLLRDDAYRFISIGRKIERADMTARILKVAGGDIISRENQYIDLQPFLWGAVLDALYAKSAFRRIKGPVISKEQTFRLRAKFHRFPKINYLLHQRYRPRSRKSSRKLRIKKILRKQKKLSTRTMSKMLALNKSKNLIKNSKITLSL